MKYSINISIVKRYLPANHPIRRVLYNRLKFPLYVQNFSNWWMVYLDKFGLLKNPYEIKLRSGIKIKLRPRGERWIVNEILLGQSYNWKSYEIKKGDIVFDIGAHIGVFSIYAAKRGAKVYAFEPNPDTFKLLRENIQANKINDVKLFPVACAGKDQYRWLYCYPLSDSPTSTLYKIKELEKYKGKKIKVKCLSLPTIIESSGVEKIDFLKMDCEGGEFEILYNTPQRYLDKIKIIAAELHPFGGMFQIKPLERFLKDSGFRKMRRYYLEKISCWILLAKR